MKKNRILFVMFVMLIMMSLSACNDDGGGTGPQKVNDALLATKNNIEENESVKDDGMIDILAVITGIDMSEKNISVKTVVTNGKDTSDYNQAQKEYSLSYTGGTDVRSSYDSVISVSQLKVGEVVNITYNSKQDKINKIVISPDTFVRNNVTGVELAKTGKTLTEGKTTYQYTNNTIVMADGKEVSMDTISADDVLTLRGNGKELYSVTVDKGHGYIKLSGYSQFLDGYIEIGDIKVLKITQDMVIPVTEGTYKVILSKGDVTAVRNITVAKEQTVLAEFEEYLQAPNKQGSIKFDVAQTDARVYIDGAKVDHTKLVEVEYGIHTMTIVTNGYDNYIETFIVDSIYQEIDIDLDGITEDETKDEKETKDETESESETETETETSTQSND